MTEQVGVEYNISGNYGSTLSQMIAQNDQYARQTDGLIGQIGRLNQITVGLISHTTALTGVNKVATAEAAAYQQRLAGIETTARAAGTSFSALEGITNRLARTLPGGISQAAGIVSTLQQSGLSADSSSAKVEKLARTFADLDLANGSSNGALGQSLLQLNRTFGNSEMLVGKFGDSLTTLSAKYGANAQGAASFANALAPVAATVGVSQGAIIGLSVAASRMGADGTYSANAFNKVLLDMSSNIRNGGPAMKIYADMLGTTSKELSQLFQSDPTEALLRFTDAIKTGGPQTQRYLEALGFDATRTIRALTAVSSQGNLRQIITDSTSSYGSGSTADAATVAVSSVNDQVAMLGETMSQTVAAAGKPFLGWLGDVVRMANSAAGAVAGVMQTEPVQKVGTGAAVAGQALGMAGGLASNVMTYALVRQGLGFLNRQRKQFLAGAEVAQAGGALVAGDMLPIGPKGEGGMPTEVPANAAAMFGMRVGQRLPAGPDFRIPEVLSHPVRALGSVAETGILMGARGISGADYLSRTYTNPETGKVEPLPYSKTQMYSSATEGRREVNTLISEARKAEQLTFSEAMQGRAKAWANWGRDMAVAERPAMRVAGAMAKFAGEAGSLVARDVGRAGSMLGMTAKTIGPMIAIGAGIEGIQQFQDANARGAQGREMVKSGATDIYGMYNDFAAAAGVAGKGATSLSMVFGQSAEQIARSVTTITEAYKVQGEQLAAARTQGYQAAFTPMSGNANEIAAQARGVLGASPSPADLQRVLMDIEAQNPGMGNTVGALLQKQNPADVLSQMFQTQTAALNPLGNPTAASDLLGKSIVSYSAQTSVNAASVYGPKAGEASKFADAKTLWDQAQASKDPAQMTQAAQEISNSLGIDDPDYVEAQMKSGVSFGTWASGAASATKPTSGWRGGGNRYVNQNTTGEGSSPLTWAVNAAQGNPQNPQDVNIGVGVDTNLTFGKTYQDLIKGGWNPAKPQDFSMITATPAQRSASDELDMRFATGAKQATLGRDVFEMTDIAKRFGISPAELMASTKPEQVAARSGASDTAQLVAAYKSDATETNRAAAIQNIMAKAMVEAGGDFAKATSQLLARGSAAGSSSTPEGQLYLGAAAQAAATGATDTRAWWVKGQQTIAAGVEAKSAPQYEPGSPEAQGQQQLQTDAKDQLDRDNAFRKQMLDAQIQYGFAKQRSEEQIQTASSRAWEDYYRNLGYMQADYQLQTQHTMRDFGISLGRQVEDAAKNIYNPYERISAQPIWDASTLLLNMQQQNSVITTQTAQVKQLRKAGLSQNAVDQLKLTDPNNAQQVTELLNNLQNDPNMIKMINATVAARLAATKGMIVNPNNVDYRRNLQDLHKNLSDASVQYERAVSRAGDALHVSLTRMRQDQQIQLGFMREDMRRMGTEASGDYQSITHQFMAWYEGLSAAEKDKVSPVVKAMYDKAYKDIGSYLYLHFGMALPGTGVSSGAPSGVTGPGGVSSGGSAGATGNHFYQWGNGTKGGTNGQMIIVLGPNGITWGAGAGGSTATGSLPNTAASALSFAAKSVSGAPITPGLCDHQVALDYGLANSGYHSARIHWQSIPSKYKTPGSGDAPPGGLVFWDTGKDGHVALSAGGGMVYTTDFKRPGHIDLVPIRDITRAWGPLYGWSQPYFEGKSTPLKDGGIVGRRGLYELADATHGPQQEAVLPLNAHGAKVLSDTMVRYLSSGAAQTARVAPYATPVQSYYYDQRTQILGEVIVQAQDPNEMARKLQAKARLDNLRQPVGAGR